MSVPLAQLLLVDLADARLWNAVDEQDLLGWALHLGELDPPVQLAVDGWREEQARGRRRARSQKGRTSGPRRPRRKHSSVTAMSP